MFGGASHRATEKDAGSRNAKQVLDLGGERESKAEGGKLSNVCNNGDGRARGVAPARHRRHAATPRYICPHLPIIHAAAAAWKWGALTIT